MGRTAKLLFVIFLLLLLIYPLFSTAYTAINSPVSVESNTIINETASDDADITIMHYAPSSSVALIIFESLVFSICVAYLVFTSFCKKDIKEVFGENKAVIYSFSLLSFCLCHTISFMILYFVQSIIMTK